MKCDPVSILDKRETISNLVSFPDLEEACVVKGKQDVPHE